MKIVSLFNNKGGVGKTTLAYHLANVLAEMDKKVLIVDLDPQCNITICGISQDRLQQIWSDEEDFITDFQTASKKKNKRDFKNFNKKNHSIHYILKPTEDGLNELSDDELPEPINLSKNLHLIPGRLTINRFESTISDRWPKAYLGDPLALRTISKIRKLMETYAQKYNYDFVIIDTSPSLGALNKVIISTVDGFIIPCLPDMFSLYGIMNIGDSLKLWQKEFKTIYGLISEEQRLMFPSSFVHFLGYTIYNARKYTGKMTGPWNLAQAHLNYAKQIPNTINKYIVEDVRRGLSKKQISDPIGGTAVMHSHNTPSNMSQKYKCPIWKVPDCKNLDAEDEKTIKMNSNKYYTSTFDSYKKFAEDFLNRIKVLG